MQRHNSILIVGAGAFGTSTAYHLSQRGYTNVTVLDRYPIPSCEAASTDCSKIVRTDYNEPLYARLATEAMEAWRSEMFRDLYHQSGWILSAKELSIPFVKGSIETNRKMGTTGLEELSVDDIRRRHPVIKGKLDGWNINVWNPHAAWVEADSALNEWRKRQRHQGSDKVILASGAWTPSLVDLNNQLTAKGHSVAHIQLTGEEALHYSQMPVLDSLELGYYFPPTKDNVFKLAHSQFIVNTKTVDRKSYSTSVPHTLYENPKDDLPLEIEATMRRNLKRVLPELADRPFCYTRLCWDADSADRHLLITPHPKEANLFLACGGSAHSFKFLPILGKYVVDMLEGKLDRDTAEKWRWRSGQAGTFTNMAHLDPEIELVDLSGWKGRKWRETVESRL